ncbi:MAG: MFS transporter [Candidatus Latescibacteria bacterium]|nr:MFS transporter [Candidatus Latescibacterota bacterium]
MDAAGARLFRNKSFRALWLGQFVSILGDRLHYLALLALIVERAHDPRNPAPELALIPAVSFLPAILFGPMAGALIDSWNVRRVLITSDLIRGCVVLLLIPAAVWGGLPAAFAAVFLLFAVNVFFLPARSAIVPDLVPSEDLVRANSLATLAGVAATIAGSFLGGLLVERVGWRWAFAIDGATYFLSVAFLAATRPVPHARKPAPEDRGSVYRALRRDVVEGARISVADRAVLGSLLALASLWAAGGALHVAGTVLIVQRTRGFVSGLGGLLAVFGFGMAAGTLLLASRGSRWSKRALVSGGLAGSGAMIALFALVSDPLVAALASFAAGWFTAFLLVTTESVVQASVGREARGRVFALRDFMTRVAVLGTAGFVGLALGRHWISAEWAVSAAGAMLIVTGAWGFLGWRRA